MSIPGDYHFALYKGYIGDICSVDNLEVLRPIQNLGEAVEWHQFGGVMELRLVDGVWDTYFAANQPKWSDIVRMQSLVAEVYAECDVQLGPNSGDIEGGRLIQR